MLKGAFVGFGNVALNGHVPAWMARPDVEIVAAADVHSQRRRLFEERFPAAGWHDTLESMLETERLDFVDICTPPAFHAASIRLALERGLHVLCEKPLVTSADEVPQLAAEARRRDRALATVHNWRHAPVLARATELVRSGAIGQVRRCRWETLREQPAAAAQDSGSGGNWRVDPAIAGGGILVDHGWHALYVLQQWFAGEPARVLGTLETRGPGQGRGQGQRQAQALLEDTATVLLEYPEATAEIFLTWTASERANRVHLEGTGGSLRIDGGDLDVRGEPAGELRRERPGGSLAEGSHHPDWFAGVAQEFLAEVRDPCARGKSLAEADRCARWIRAARVRSSSAESLSASVNAGEAS